MPSILANANANLAGGQQYNKPAFVATGGTVTTFVSGGINYTSHKFTGSESTSLTDTLTVLGGATSAQLLVVAGGGSGGNSANQFTGGGGGGAGGLIYSASFDLSPYSGYPAIFNVLVGKGGQQGLDQNGVSSSFNPTILYSNQFPLVAIGGGAGGGGVVGKDGGSGGGSGGATSGSGVLGQGFAGNRGDTSKAGGGGGASQTGSLGTGIGTAHGGSGSLYPITGTDTFYAGGGAGGFSGNQATTLGGPGGGGNGVFGTNGTSGSMNLGAGGGGGWAPNDSSGARQGGAGGCGVVIVTYKSGGS